MKGYITKLSKKEELDIKLGNLFNKTGIYNKKFLD